jgi:ribose-phosphate pyrophosphokinase
MKLFSGSSNKPLAEDVARSLGLQLSPIERFVFPDGETRIQIQVPVLGEDTVVIQSTNPPVDSHYLELFLIVDGLKRSGAKSVTVVMPYMGYMRQDHLFRDGEAVSLLVMIKILESLGVDRFISFDFHTIKIPEFFHIPVTHISALPLFAKKIKDNGWDETNAILVSPDMGGIRRVKDIANLLNMPWIATIKSRDLSNGKVTINGIEGNGEQLNGKHALIIDDMISSGSIVESAAYLYQYGIKETYIFVTHPIFSSKAPEVLENSSVREVFVTDGVYIPAERKFSKLSVLSLADQIAKELQKR